jgi:uncharacterized membrane protein (DUF4010 family)
MNEFALFAIAVGLGLLVGLQRQHSDTVFAGLRTFPMVAIFGFLCALGGSPVLTGAGLVGVSALVAVAHWATGRPGLTTEFALLCMYGIGAMTALGHQHVAIAATVTMALLLEFKGELHGIVKRLGEKDIKAILQFAVISLLILPLAPDVTYGPYQVLNPRQIWWMVVLIVGINLAGYLSYKFISSKGHGVLISGVLGGMVSSTATTASFSRQRLPESHIVILLAGATVYVRLAMEVLSTAPQIASEVLPRLVLPFLGLSVAAVWFWFRKPAASPDVEPPSAPEDDPHRKAHNPAEIRLALVFALAYAVVLVLNAAAKDLLGDSGVIAVAVVGGLTDVDAITLSTTQLVNAGRVTASTAWQAILIASLSNVVFKCGIAMVLGGRELGGKVLLASVGAILVSLAAWGF